MIFCPKCGSGSESARFCRLCGTNLALVSDALSDAEPPGRVVATRGGGTTLGLFQTPTVSNSDRDLDGHSACSIFGGVTIDLTAGLLREGETSISVFAIFGGTEVFVPDDVAIRVTGVTIFGGVKVRGQQLGNGMFSPNDYSTPGYALSPRRLHIDATAIFGEVKIKR
jgi:hypothetical protein